MFCVHLLSLLLSSSSASNYTLFCCVFRATFTQWYQVVFLCPKKKHNRDDVQWIRCILLTRNKEQKNKQIYQRSQQISSPSSTLSLTKHSHLCKKKQKLYLFNDYCAVTTNEVGELCALNGNCRVFGFWIWFCFQIIHVYG